MLNKIKKATENLVNLVHQNVSNNSDIEITINHKDLSVEITDNNNILFYDFFDNYEGIFIFLTVSNLEEILILREIK